MRKTFLLALLALSVVTASAMTFYVDPVNGNDTDNDGQSWAKAFKTVQKAHDVANAAPYDVTVDDIFVKQGQLDLTEALKLTSKDNFYGSFRGDESSPAARPMADKDGNGFIEPWEFEYQTVLYSTYDGSYTGNTVVAAFNVNLTNDATFNGFELTNVPVIAAPTGKYRVVHSATRCLFECNIIRNCDISGMTVLNNASAGGILVQIGANSGTMLNCLIEDNKVAALCGVTNPDGDKTSAGSIVPGVNIDLLGKLVGCVFRNNFADLTIDANITGNGSNYNYSNMRGMWINTNPSDKGVTNTSSIINCLVYNNEVNYDATAKPAATATGIASVCLNAFSSSTTADTIIGCTMANNLIKNSHAFTATGGINILRAGAVATGYKVNYAHNIIAWGNVQNNAGTSTVRNITINSNVAEGLITNLAYNGGASGFPGTPNAFVFDNYNDVHNDNTGDTKSPVFTAPTTFVGYAGTDKLKKSEIQSANWRPKPTSYLAGKGRTISDRTTDISGRTFAASRAIGAYEVYAPSGSESVVNDAAATLRVVAGGIQALESGLLLIYNAAGTEVKQLNVTEGQIVAQPAGFAIIRLGASSLKVVK